MGYYMKKLFLISLIIVHSCIAFAQNCCMNDTIVREIQFPLTEQDTEPVFYYFNNEWIPLAYENEIQADSIQSAKIKNDYLSNSPFIPTAQSATRRFFGALAKTRLSTKRQ